MKHLTALSALLAVALTGCVTDPNVYRADVYSAGQVNQAQEVKTVEIIAISPARVAVDNRANRETARNIGMIIGTIAGVAIANQMDGGGGPGPHHHHDPVNQLAGGAAGAAVGSIAGAAAGGPETTLVEGVQLTFREGSRLLNSAQVGRPCEFKLGTAIMISPSPNETRIQPNNPGGCPPPSSNGG